MTNHNITPPLDDPWGTSTVAELRLPNVFQDANDKPVTVTTDLDGQCIQISHSTGTLRLDPIEAEKLAKYLAKTSDKLYGDLLSKS